MTATHVWVVFHGHGHYADSIWTDHDAALARATEIARQENASFDANWERQIEDYIQRWKLNTPGQWRAER